ncbi:MAG: TSUP family transporter [Desulfotomaculales bacterium]
MYLPFAETFVNPYAVVLIGLGAGLLVRLLGSTGYLVLAPALNIFGVPSVTAVGTTCALLLSANVAETFRDTPAPRVSRAVLIITAAAALAGAVAGQRLLLALRELDLAAPALRLAYAAALVAAFALLVRRGNAGRRTLPHHRSLRLPAALAAGLALGGAGMPLPGLAARALEPEAGAKGMEAAVLPVLLPAALWATYAYGAAGAVELGLWGLVALGVVIGRHLGGLVRRRCPATVKAAVFGGALPAFAAAVLLRQLHLTPAAGYLVLLTILVLMLGTGWLLAAALLAGPVDVGKVEEHKRIL